MRLAFIIVVLSSAYSVAFPLPARSELPPQGEHIVRSGETLGRLADRYGLSVAALAEANDIVDVDLIRVGSVLKIGVRRSVPTREAAVRGQSVLQGGTVDHSKESALAPSRPAADAPQIALARIEALYREARFHDALTASHEQVFPKAPDPTLRARLELLRGKLEAAFGNAEKARGHFRRARELDPTLELRPDPSPKIAALFRAAAAGAN